MKVIMDLILQNKTDLKFIQDRAGVWTARRDKALIFSNSLQAMFFCFNRRMGDMQIMAIFDDSRMNFTIPITDAGGG